MTTTLPATTTETTSRPADVELELFYLDLETCEPCQGAHATVHEAAQQLHTALQQTGRTLSVRAVRLDDAEQAAALGIVSSPTVRVNGADVYLPVVQDHCQTCSAIADTPIDCRTYSWHGDRYPHPPTGMIVEAVYRQLEIEATIRRHPELAHDIAADEEESASDIAEPSSVERFFAALAVPAPGGSADVRLLRHRLRGRLFIAEDDGWEQAKGTYNLVVDQQPAMVVVPADAQDVVTVVDYARDRGMQVVPQRTGHNAEPLGSLAGTILLRTDAMRTVHVDVYHRVATVGAGAKWEDVIGRAAQIGLAALHGSTPDVSVAGYSMGGGVGWYARALGLAANSVTAIEIVTADGHLRWVDHDNDPELFWALRGGGGNFGVVTAMEFRLYPIEEVYAGALFFPWERSAEVLHAWHDWTRTVPDEVTSVGRIIQFPPDDGLPEPLRGKSFVIVEAVAFDQQVIDDEKNTASLLEPLRRLGPVLDTFTLQPPSGIAELHMDPPLPLPYTADHLVLSDLTTDAIDALVSAVGPGSGSELISVEIRHLGGALSRPPAGHGALAGMPGEYLLFGVGAAPDPAAAKTVRARLAAMTTSMQHLASGLYFNFTEHRIDPARIFTPDTYRRLQRVRRRVDPGNLFRANHSIPVD